MSGKNTVREKFYRENYVQILILPGKKSVPSGWDGGKNNRREGWKFLKVFFAYNWSLCEG